MKTFAIRLLKIAASLVAVLLVIHALLLLVSGISLHNAYRDLRDAGRPMSPEDIIPPEILPTVKNAAPLYTTAFALLNSEFIDGQVLGDRLGEAAAEYKMNPDDDPKTQTFMDLLANKTVVQVLDLVRQATTRSQCNFNLQYDQGAMMLVPHINGMLRIGRVLQAQALLEARQGYQTQAWQTVETFMQMANSLRDEPVLISALVRIALYQMALATVQDFAELLPPDEQIIYCLDQLIAPANDPNPILLGLDGERLFFGEWLFDHDNAQRLALRLIQSAMEAGAPAPEPRYIVWLLPYRPTRQFQHAIYLKTFKKFTDNIFLPLERPSHGPEPEPTMQNRWYGGLLHSFEESYSRTRIVTAKMQANARVTRTGLALLRHKAAHGAYPATLDEIDPQFLEEIPLDPFTGQPLVYRPEGDGFLLYSLGENLDDDGGTEETPDNRESRAFDIVWRMPR